MLEQLENGNMKDSSSDKMSNGASVKVGGVDNQAYAGVPQVDDVKTLSDMGEQKIEEQKVERLAAHLLGEWERAKEDRDSNGIDEMLVSCLRQYESRYSDHEINELSAKGFPLVYFPLSEHKVHTAVAWIDEFFSNSETLFNLKPTPVPEMESDVNKMTLWSVMNDIIGASIAEAQRTGQQAKAPPAELVKTYAEKKRPIVEAALNDEATNRAYRMEKVIRDDFIQGKWSGVIKDVIGYTSIFGTGGLRSPTIKVKKDVAWENGKIVKKDRIVRGFEAISPFDIFPAPGTCDSQSGNFIVRVRYNPIELSAMRKNPLWREDKISDVLVKYGVGGIELNVSSDTERKFLNKQRPSTGNDKLIEGFEFWGTASGEMLHELGIVKTPDDKPIENTAWDWYNINAVVVGSDVIYCRVMDDGEDRPVDVVKFYDNPGSFWGRGPLNLISSLQKICNAAGRSIVVNMGFACGPQGIVDVGQLSTSDDMKIRPFKLWAVKRSAYSQNGGKPIEFFTIDSIAKQLTDVFQFFQRLADEVTGIPAYANGTDAMVGAGRTATGLNMLMSTANRGIKKVVGNFDELAMSSVQRFYRWHLVNNNDTSIKGDVRIEVTGLRYFTTKTARANDLLNLMDRITANPALAQIPGAERMVDLLHDVAIAFDLSPYALAPTKDEYRQQVEEQKRQMMEMQAQAEQAQANANAQEIQKVQAEEQAKAEANGLTPTGRPQYAARDGSGVNA